MRVSFALVAFAFLAAGAVWANGPRRIVLGDSCVHRLLLGKPISNGGPAGGGYSIATDLSEFLFRDGRELVLISSGYRRILQLNEKQEKKRFHPDRQSDFFGAPVGFHAGHVNNDHVIAARQSIANHWSTYQPLPQETASLQPALHWNVGVDREKRYLESKLFAPTAKDLARFGVTVGTAFYAIERVAYLADDHFAFFYPLPFDQGGHLICIYKIQNSAPSLRSCFRSGSEPFEDFRKVPGTDAFIAENSQALKMLDLQGNTVWEAPPRSKFLHVDEAVLVFFTSDAQLHLHRLQAPAETVTFDLRSSRGEIDPDRTFVSHHPTSRDLFLLEIEDQAHLLNLAEGTTRFSIESPGNQPTLIRASAKFGKFSPDGSYFWTTAQNRSVAFWSTTDGRPLGLIVPPEDIRRVQVSWQNPNQVYVNGSVWDISGFF